jgi:hypothetical protein
MKTLENVQAAADTQHHLIVAHEVVTLGRARDHGNRG